MRILKVVNLDTMGMYEDSAQWGIKPEATLWWMLRFLRYPSFED